MVYEWKNKVVVITGGASGIGALVVQQLQDEGTKHVAILDVTEAIGIELQNQLNTKYGVGKVKFYKCDVTNDDQLYSSFNAVLEEQSYIDVVINNAGIMNDSMKLYKKEIEINVTALVTGTLKALEIMRKDRGGRGGTVINISSVAGITLSPDMPIYWATKSAVIQFSSCIGLKEYYERTGMRVLSICFGATTTSLLTTQKLGSFDEEINKGILDSLTSWPIQSPESAARGLIEAYKQGESGSTWLVANEKPALDITPTLMRGYSMLEELVFKN